MSALLAAEQRIVRGNSRNLFAACARLVIRRCLLWARNHSCDCFTQMTGSSRLAAIHDRKLEDFIQNDC